MKHAIQPWHAAYRALLIYFSCFAAVTINAETPLANSNAAHESPSLRRATNALVTVPPGNGLPQFCTRTTDANTGRSTCADRGSQSEPVIYATSYDNGAFVIKLLFFLKTANPSSFVLYRVNTATKQETFLTQWDDAAPLSERYGKAISVSPDGKRIALIRSAPPLKDAPSSLKQGAIELFDIENKTWRSTNADALDSRPVQWLDDQRILFSRGVRRESANAALLHINAAADQFGSSYAQAPVVPLIVEHDLNTGAERMIHVGVNVIALRGRDDIVVQDSDAKLRHVKGGNSTAIAAPPGMTHRGIVGAAGASRVLHWAAPSDTLEARYTQSNSPIVGAKRLLSLRITDLQTGEFFTVVERIDPRSRPSIYVKP
jgi:hypothetical protein